MAAYYNEFDPYAAAWLRELIKNGLIADGEVDERSIKDVQPEDVRGFTQCHFFAGIGGWSYALRLAGWDDDRPVWTGSCPCQPFSSQGKRSQQQDERHLWPDWYRLIKQSTPPILFGEQVNDAVASGWLDEVFIDLESDSYACAAADIPACAATAPHHRERIWFCGWHSSSKWPAKKQIKSEREDSWLDRVRNENQWWGRTGYKPTFPWVDNGVFRRMALVRGYGNAIVPAIAAAFIQASEESIKDLFIEV